MKQSTFLKRSAVIFTLVISGATSAQTQIGNNIIGEAKGDFFGQSVSMPDVSTIAVGAPFNAGNGSQSGHVRIYRWNGNNWNQKGSDIDGEASLDESGAAVSMPDANTVAIGAPWNDGNGFQSGQVRIYKWNGTAWIQKGGDIDGEASGDISGVAVSMPDANTIAIGAPRNDGNGSQSGHVRIFGWNGSNWIQKGGDINGESGGNNSGTSVSMPDANTVAIGAPTNNGNGNFSGHVRLYQWNGFSWVQKGSDIDGEAAEDNSGWAVSMPDANTVSIGAPHNSWNGLFYGHVRIYRWNGSNWTQKGIDIDGIAKGERSGSAVSMPDANTLAIGAPYYGEFAQGIARIYNWNGSTWVQKGIGIIGEVNGSSGTSVSMPDANTVAIGGPGANYAQVYDMYCQASSISASSFWIKGVNVNGVNNISGASTYSNFTNVAFNVNHGSGASVTLFPGSIPSDRYYRVGWSIWLDINKDGDFNDAGELALQGIGTSHLPFSGNLSSLATSRPITTRMRVLMYYPVGYPVGQGASPCGTVPHGEYEDYTINIVPYSGPIPADLKNLTEDVPLTNEYSSLEQRLNVLNPYPNPAKNVLNFNLDLKENEKIEMVEVRDMLGNIVMHLNANEINQNKIDLSKGLSTGSYLLNVTTNNANYKNVFMIE